MVLRVRIRYFLHNRDIKFDYVVTGNDNIKFRNIKFKKTVLQSSITWWEKGETKSTTKKTKRT